MLGKSTRFSGELVGQLVLFVDILMVWLSAYLAIVWRFGAWDAVGSNYKTLILASSLIAAVCSSVVYQSYRGGGRFAIFTRINVAWLATCTLMIAWLFFSKSSQEYSRLFMGTWMVMMLAALLMGRLLSMSVLRWFSRLNYKTKSVLVIGSGPMSAGLEQRAKDSAWSGYRVVQTVDPQELSKVEDIASQYDFDEVWINLAMADSAFIPKVLFALRHSACDIRLVPDLMTYSVINHGITFIMGMPMLDISASGLVGVNRVVKALEDYILATLILLMISPILLAIAIAVKVTSPGPVLFMQRRHGWNGEEITVYKFRSMKQHQECGNTITQATKNDSRLTSIGGFLRRTSLDELPQFFNVLQGRMSVVGPRPHAIQHNHYYKELIPRYMLRHKMKPGITGWAQVNGLRGETDTLDKMEARVDYDLHYLENWSLLLDIRIVFLTIFKGFIHKNAH